MRRQNRFNRNHKSNAKKEKIIMIASSAFVLAALTMTGVYVKNSNERAKNDGYNIDFSALENNVQDEVPKNDIVPAPSITEDDLDYTPMEQVDSGIVEIPGLTDQTAQNPNKPRLSGEGYLSEGADLEGENGLLEQAAGEAENGEMENEGDAEEGLDTASVTQTEQQREPDFQAGDTLVWPVSGNVLIPYSMEKTVYFATLAQYKYNPALIISATEGDIISAAAAGKVLEVFYDDEIGNAVRVDIGNGYEITYGQLEDVEVSKGSFLEEGDIIGYVASPTKYYSVEGTNVYFSLAKDGTPVDPMGELQ